MASVQRELHEQAARHVPCCPLRKCAELAGLLKWLACSFFFLDGGRYSQVVQIQVYMYKIDFFCRSLLGAAFLVFF